MPTEITDEYMNEMRAKTRAYTVLLLRRTPRLAEPDAFPIVWEHGRRNHQLRAGGVLPIDCWIPDDEEMAGIGIFNAGPKPPDAGPHVRWCERGEVTPPPTRF